MLLHLPIAILATLSPVAVSDNVPKFDIVRECRFEGGSTVDFARCSQDEAEALEQLKANWARFTGVDKSSCVGAAAIGGVASYVELLTCLEMAREAKRCPDPGNACRGRSASKSIARLESSRRQRRRPDDAAAQGSASARHQRQ
jgi:hypothetical protein